MNMVLQYYCYVCGRPCDGSFYTDDTLHVLCGDCWLIYRQLKNRYPWKSDLVILKYVYQIVTAGEK